jgi:hypothetical protein
MAAWNGAKILRDSLGAFAGVAARRGAAQPGHEPLDVWLSPSQVAEYVYCPEAHRLKGASRPPETIRQAEGKAGHDEMLVRFKRSRSLAPARVLLWLMAIAGALAALLALSGRL